MIIKSLKDIRQINLGKIMKGHLNINSIRQEFDSTAWKLSKYGVISGPFFPVFRLNTEIYGVNLRKSPDSVRIQENTDQK